ncbi:hypothetical protein BC936DRAFT_140102 [Jimgerdemannia flammicorona]|uniref:Uncharacterized protein n=2 Tax=Jimgerdemannia flammicorona TaxID=994334 RepID=A0A433QTA5_9FUNG|nr:hypothetical protein BC936DRAFT_140102 [Jimgerdemannia flammicorona]RUS33024.1 hypothetical protein BC938DRAFT_473477 [Jimgerdemannia flammicorona]
MRYLFCFLCDCGPRATLFQFRLIQLFCAAGTLASFSAAVILQDDLDAITGGDSVRQGTAYFFVFSVSAISTVISLFLILSSSFCAYNKGFSANKYLAIVMTIIWTATVVYLMASEGGFQTCSAASTLSQQQQLNNTNNINGTKSTIIDFGLHICPAQIATRAFGLGAIVWWFLCALWIDARLAKLEFDSEVSMRTSQRPTRYASLLRLLQFLGACSVLASHTGTIVLLQQQSLETTGIASLRDSPPHAPYILWLCAGVVSVVVSLWLIFATCRYGSEGMYCERYVAVAMTFFWTFVITYNILSDDTFQPCSRHSASNDPNNVYYRCVIGNVTCAFAIMTGACWTIRALWYVHGLCEVMSAKYMARRNASSTKGDEAKEAAVNCVVCMTNSREMAFVPCGHYCVCIECSANFTHTPADGGRNMRSKEKCPLCRQEVFDVMKIYG